MKRGECSGFFFPHFVFFFFSNPFSCSLLHSAGRVDIASRYCEFFKNKSSQIQKATKNERRKKTHTHKVQFLMMYFTLLYFYIFFSLWYCAMSCCVLSATKVWGFVWVSPSPLPPFFCTYFPTLFWLWIVIIFSVCSPFVFVHIVALASLLVIPSFFWHRWLMTGLDWHRGAEPHIFDAPMPDISRMDTPGPGPARCHSDRHCFGRLANDLIGWCCGLWVLSYFFDPGVIITQSPQ